MATVSLIQPHGPTGLVIVIGRCWVREVWGLATESSTGDAMGAVSRPGLVGVAGASAAREVAKLAARRQDLEAELRRCVAREDGFQAAVLSEPVTAAHLGLLIDQGWRVLHDRRWPQTTNANVDHLTVGYGGVAVIDTKDWSAPVEVRGQSWSRC